MYTFPFIGDKISFEAITLSFNFVTLRRSTSCSMVSCSVFFTAPFSSLTNEVVVSSDCENMLSIAKNYGVEVQKRQDRFCSNTIPMNLVYEHLAENIKCDIASDGPSVLKKI